MLAREQIGGNEHIGERVGIGFDDKLPPPTAQAFAVPADAGGGGAHAATGCASQSSASSTIASSYK